MLLSRAGGGVDHKVKEDGIMVVAIIGSAFVCRVKKCANRAWVARIAMTSYTIYKKERSILIRYKFSRH